MKWLWLSVFFITSFTMAAENSKSEKENSQPPSWVEKVFLSKKLNEQYEFSFRISPSYLKGDFNGDKKADIAILIKEKKSGKNGIAIFHAVKNEVFIMGAGKELGNGGDDFYWMDIWSIYPKGPVHRGVGETTIPVLKGDALLVEKSESASAIIYWNGKKYCWYQQGD